MTYTHFWPLIYEALGALGNHYIPAMDEVSARECVDRNCWALLFAALGFDPSPISNEILQKRMPYQEYSHRLDEAVEQDLLKVVGECEYRLTDKGQSVVQQIILAAYARMEHLAPLSANDLHYLSVLLHRLVKASHTSAEPPGKWCITHSRRFDPGENAPLLIQVDQYLSNLAAYRDDAHLAAWQPLGFGGPTWETLTLLWRGEANSLDELPEKLSYRQQSQAVYEKALQVLRDQGLIKDTNGKYMITKAGEMLRQEAEEATDRYFYAPWDRLAKEDLESLENLLKLLIKGL